jgi:hypothetical protein
MISHIRKQQRGRVRLWLSAPVIYLMIIPLVFLDVCLWLYQTVCFPLYGIAPVPRKQYVRDSRRRLGYLSRFDRLNCWYCGYANGLIHYAREIAARTERFWCPIKQQFEQRFFAPAHHKGFVEPGDVSGLAATLTEPSQEGGEAEKTVN